MYAYVNTFIKGRVTALRMTINRINKGGWDIWGNANPYFQILRLVAKLETPTFVTTPSKGSAGSCNNDWQFIIRFMKCCIALQGFIPCVTTPMHCWNAFTNWFSAQQSKLPDVALISPKLREETPSLSQPCHTWCQVAGRRVGVLGHPIITHLFS